MAQDLQWQDRGLCTTQEPDALFVTGKAQNDAARICKRCTVIATCLAYALDTQQEFGVWGGQTERQRRALLRSHPRISSWDDVLVG